MTGNLLDIAQINGSEGGNIILIFNDNTIIETTSIDINSASTFTTGYIFESSKKKN